MKLKLILFIFLLSSNGLLAQIKNEDKTNLSDFSKKLFTEILDYTNNNLKDDMSILIIRKK